MHWDTPEFLYLKTSILVKHLKLDNLYTQVPERFWEGKNSVTMRWHNTKIQTEDICEKAFVEPKRFHETSAQYSIIIAELSGQLMVLSSTIIFLV